MTHVIYLIFLFKVTSLIVSFTAVFRDVTQCCIAWHPKNGCEGDYVIKYLGKLDDKYGSIWGGGGGGESNINGILPSTISKNY